ncbi:hypothetical protein [Periweissella fabalis]|uniref:Uncharacterized protein n=1 Tax=Periweissella fabalis TaxID=1070421 RepID=A0A7X6N5C3_9LACO|nr:hypothetical protein [Periweissella fabalis]MCM0598325.1 hypothetical protein [Periweissella fabalis]NKZ24957.1 hypothetical protein [Periweissella fabalis]
MNLIERILTDAGMLIGVIAGLYAFWRFLFKASFNDAINAFTTPIMTSVDRLTDKIEVLNNRLDQLDPTVERVESLETQVESLDKQSALHEQRLQQLENRKK